MKYYHWTSKNALKNILKEGLVPGPKGFIALSNYASINFWRDQPSVYSEVLLEITIEDLDNFIVCPWYSPESNEKYMIGYQKNISPKNIKIYEEEDK